MEDSRSARERVEVECNESDSISQNGLSMSDKNVDSAISLELGEEVGDEVANSREKSIERGDNATGTRVKRKTRSTRRKLKAMINNSSLHFSDTDSEGELASINSQIQTLNRAEAEDQVPVIISVTLDSSGDTGSNLLSPDDKNLSRRGSGIVDYLTDIDEIYPSEPENEQKISQNTALNVEDCPCYGDTDLEDIEGEDEVRPMICVESRSDIFCDYSGGTITTKEGNGPFSIEVRNKMYHEEDSRGKLCSGMLPDIVLMPNTDEEDIDVSDEDEVMEACHSQRVLFEDLEAMAASQVVVRNVDKMGNMVAIKDVSDDVISDSHTDVEDVDSIE